MSDNTFKILVCGGAALVLISILSCGSQTKKEPSDGNVAFEKNLLESNQLNTKKVFAPGEHVLSVPFYKDPTRTRLQYPYYEGYSAIGLSSSSYGEIIDVFYGGAILYVNNVEVVCNQTTTDESGNIVFSEFGIPTSAVQEIDSNITATTKDFGVGEHIISIPVDVDPNKSNVQYGFGSSDCYEVVDISATAFGRALYVFGGSCVLYVNTVPVRCTATSQDENGNIVYCDFGSPIDLENTKKLK